MDAQIMENQVEENSWKSKMLASLFNKAKKKTFENGRKLKTDGKDFFQTCFEKTTQRLSMKEFL